MKRKSGGVSEPKADSKSLFDDSKATTEDLELFGVAWSLAHLAGDLIRTRVYQSNKTITAKSTAVDNVTETDVACEKLIIEAIRQKYPTHKFIAEESDSGGGVYDVSDSITWIIDPIDGTTNYIHGLPFVCVSIGVMKDRRIRCGVIHAPLLGETYHSVVGCGSYVTKLRSATRTNAQQTSHIIPVAPIYSLTTQSTAQSTAHSTAQMMATFPTNDSKCALTGAVMQCALIDEHSRLHTSGQTKVGSAAIIMEFGYDRTAKGVDLIFGVTRALLLEGVHAVRAFGSCALNTCQIAAGRADVYWEGKDTTRGPKPWDLAACSLIATEAGCVIHDVSGGEFSMWSGRLLVASSETLAAHVAAVKATSDAAVLKQYDTPTTAAAATASSTSSSNVATKK